MLAIGTSPSVPASPLWRWLEDLTGWLARRVELDQVYRASWDRLSTRSGREMRDIGLDLSLDVGRPGTEPKVVLPSLW
jgi:hypothetical protein